MMICSAKSLVLLLLLLLRVYATTTLLIPVSFRFVASPAHEMCVDE